MDDDVPAFAKVADALLPERIFAALTAAAFFAAACFAAIFLASAALLAAEVCAFAFGAGALATLALSGRAPARAGAAPCLTDDRAEEDFAADLGALALAEVAV